VTFSITLYKLYISGMPLPGVEPGTGGLKTVMKKKAKQCKRVDQI
jgi:hypothetical protein